MYFPGTYFLYATFRIPFSSDCFEETVLLLFLLVRAIQKFSMATLPCVYSVNFLHEFSLKSQTKCLSLILCISFERSKAFLLFWKYSHRGMKIMTTIHFLVSKSYTLPFIFYAFLSTIDHSLKSRFYIVTHPS